MAVNACGNERKNEIANYLKGIINISQIKKIEKKNLKIKKSLVI